MHCNAAETDIETEGKGRQIVLGKIPGQQAAICLSGSCLFVCVAMQPSPPKIKCVGVCVRDLMKLLLPDLTLAASYTGHNSPQARSLPFWKAVSEC